MSPILSTTIMQDNASNGDDVPSFLVGVSEEEKETERFLERNDASKPVICSPSKHTPHLPTLRTLSHIGASHSHPTTSHSSKALLVYSEEGREYEAPERDRQGESGKSKETSTSIRPGEPRLVRDLAAFWLLGFCNNFTYWVMVTAAYDLLEFQEGHTERPLPPANTGQPLPAPLDTTARLPGWSNDSSLNTFTCNQHSTGAILIADTLPAVAITLAAPITMLLAVGLRVGLLSALCVASYLILGLAQPSFVFLGVALASASRGFSDSTFLGHSSNYHKHVLSLWSSGTGVATFVGPLLFSAMTTLGLHPRHALLTFLVVPFIIVVSFWCVLSGVRPSKAAEQLEPVDSAPLVFAEEIENKKQKTIAVIKERIYHFGLESIYFPASSLSHAQQYSWSITLRCLGTLISRSCHKFLLLPSTWLYCIFAVLVMVVVGSEACYHYLPSEFIIFGILFVQGILEGAAFRNTVFTLHKETSDKEREFCLGIFPISLFLPAMLAGFASIPIHDKLCQDHIFSQ